MKHTMKKTLAFLLTLVMLVNTFPLSALAAPKEGKYGPLGLSKSAGDNYHTVVVNIASDVKWEGHLYFVLKQEQVPTYGDGNKPCDQYYVQEITENGTFNIPSFKATYWGGNNNNPYDNSMPVLAQVAVNAYGINQEISPTGPINDPYGISYIETINDKPIRITTNDDTETTTINIGNVGPVPHQVVFEGWPEGATMSNNYCVVAKINGAPCYALIYSNGTIGEFKDENNNSVFQTPGWLPAQADENTVKIVGYSTNKEVWELADYFCVTSEMMFKALWWYQHGNMAVEWPN